MARAFHKTVFKTLADSFVSPTSLFSFFKQAYYKQIRMTTVSKTWSVDKAREWQNHKGKWRAGCNFVPSNAVNSLEMFHDETYDPQLIDRELQLAEELGFGTIRVFLHDLLWKHDSQAFLHRLNGFLDIAHSHKMTVMFVLLDSCYGEPGTELSLQPMPITGLHNSGWVQCPGCAVLYDGELFDSLQSYIQGVVTHFKNDPRVIAWDVWNEPNNSGYSQDLIMPLLEKVVNWVREVNPSQPITTAIWECRGLGTNNFSELQRLQLDVSDILSFHNYDGMIVFGNAIKCLKTYSPGRPLVCTEYLARTMDNQFDSHLQHMRDENVIAINWGLVTGKTQGVYSFDTLFNGPDKHEPEVWFHDIFRSDGTPYCPHEVEYIKNITRGSNSNSTTTVTTTATVTTTTTKTVTTSCTAAMMDGTALP